MTPNRKKFIGNALDQKPVWGKRCFVLSKQQVPFVRQVGACLGIALLWAISCLLLIGPSVSDAAGSDRQEAKHFDIPQQQADVSLITFAEQADITLIFTFELARDKTTNRLVGSYHPEEAIQLLLDGTGLKPTFSSDGHINIASAEAPVAGGEAMNKRVTLLAAIASVFGATTSGGVAAQTPGITAIEEVIVTASRRDERLRDVPSSVTAIGSQQLAELNAHSLEDFISQIPNINFTGLGASDRMLILRGISTSTFEQSATVATYIDDVTVGSSTALAVGSRFKPDVNTFDLERIEVLRGPQGTRYGANALGGLLKYVTKSPDTEQVSFDVRLDANSVSHGDNGYGIEAAGNFPLSDTTAIRVSAFSREDAGYINNIETGEEGINSVESTGGRVTLYSEPGDNLTVRATATLQSTDRDGRSDIRVDIPTLEPVFGEYEQERWAPEPLAQDLELYSLTVNYDLGRAVLTSTTAYNVIDVSNVTDWTRIEGGEFSGFPGVVSFPDKLDTKTEKWSQEIKLSSAANDELEWSVGAFVTGEDSYLRSLEQGLLPDGTVSTDEPTWGGGGFTTGTAENMFSSDWQSEFKQTALFGELTFHLSDAFDITGGVRWSDNETDFDQTLGGLWQCSTFDASVPSNCDANNEFVFPNAKSEDDATTFLLAGRWHLSDSTMLYARAAQGFRPGGPNSLTPAAIAAGAGVEYGSDSLTNYEIGMKTLLADNRVSIDLAAFHVDWEDIQIRQISGGFAFTGNGGEASSKGIELAVTARPTDNLSISFNVGTLDAKLEEDAPNIGVGAVAGDKLPNAPDLTHGGNINYDFPDFNGYTIGIGGSWRHVDDRLGDLGAAERLEFDSYDIYDLYASLRNDRFVLRAYAKNVTDERAVETVSPFFKYAVVSRPRTVGLSLTMSF